MYDKSGGGKGSWSIRNSHVKILMKNYPNHKQILECLTDDEEVGNVRGSKLLYDKQRRSLTVLILWLEIRGFARPL